MRERHIKWITNARVKAVEAGKMTVEEVGEDGNVRKTHELSFAYSMMLPFSEGGPLCFLMRQPPGGESVSPDAGVDTARAGSTHPRTEFMNATVCR
jgi:hypothetical protein